MKLPAGYYSFRYLCSFYGHVTKQVHCYCKSSATGPAFCYLWWPHVCNCSK